MIARTIDEAREWRQRFIRKHSRAPAAVAVPEDALEDFARSAWALTPELTRQPFSDFAGEFRRATFAGETYVFGMNLYVIRPEVVHA